MSLPRSVAWAAGSAAVVLVLAGGCAKGDQSTSGTGGPSGPSATGSSSPTGAQADVVEITVSVTGGKVDPKPSVHKVRKGQTVKLTVTSDEADELHVHGVDKEVELEAGKPTTLEFVASLTGRFEVELHKSEKQLFQLQVA